MDDLESQIRSFVVEYSSADAAKIDSLTTMFGDLGFDGLDGRELLEEFGRRFGVDMASCQPDSHFGPEVSGSPLGLVYWCLQWLFSAKFRNQSPEMRCGLIPIRVSDLVESARLGRWTIQVAATLKLGTAI